MEHKIKRFFAFLLSILMMINSVPVTAFAADGDDHSEAEIVSEHEHSLIFVEARDAGCTQDGNSAYWYCTAEDCGKFFSDEGGTAEISAESTVIAASHSWDDGVVTTEATETAEGVMTYTCGSCGTIKTEAIPMLNHTHSLSAVEATAASCTADGNSAYWYCACGKYFSDAEGTTEIAENSWVIPAAHATVEDETVGYWICTGCGQYFEDEDATMVLDPTQLTAEEGCEHSLTKIDAAKATCLSSAAAAYWLCSNCGSSFADAEGTTKLDYVARTAVATSGRTWDFSQNSTTSTDGNSTLSLTTKASNTYTEVPVADGALTTESVTAMTISNPVTLKADQDWVIEIVAKGDGSNHIGAIAVAGSYSVSTATSVHINKYGDLSILKKTSGVTDVTNGYNYYKVSNEAYEASVLASDDFDVTEYHNYQLRHSADGVYSFWLDGQKIGDLSLSEIGIDRTKTSYVESTAARDDLNVDLRISYFGCGASKTYNNYGLVGSVKYYGLYTGHTAGEDDDDCTADILCTSCDTVMVEGAKSHTPAEDDGNCTTEVLCTVCGNVATAGQSDHTWSESYTTTSEGHYKTCTNEGCQQSSALEGHTSSGAATAETPETCTVCGYEIAPALTHTHGENVTAHTGTAATCIAAGEKTYYECSCGNFYEDAACTTVIADLDSWKVIAINPDAHSFGQWQEEIPATCTDDGTKGHKTCALCQKDYDAEGKLIEDLTIKSEGHDYVAGTSTDSSCLAHGEVIYTCSVSGCGDSYVGYVPARSGTTWDFSGNGVTSTDGKNTLSFVACADETVHTSIPVADGALTTQGRVTMSLSESITLKADQDWVVEVIAKGDGINPISNILSTGKNVKTATYIFISKSGDLSIGKRFDSFVGDDGTTKSGAYVYYHVSDADYDASVLASDSFDVTEYHNYELRHSADGVFSFWVDGQKIGDLTLTENGYNRSTSYVKSTAARDDLEEDLVMTHIGGGLSGNSYTNFGVLGSIKYLGAYTGHTADADDGDCTTDVACTVCGGVAQKGAESHTLNEDDGDCTTDITCSVCGTVTTKGAQNHTPNEDDGDCTTDITCSVCGTVTTKGAQSHTPAEDDGNCTTEVLCSVCGNVATAGQSDHTWSERYTTTSEGHYKTCTNEGCQQSSALEGHTSSGAATAETPETCTVCGYEIAPALTHTHGENVTAHTGTAATCIAAGEKTYYECSCGNFYEDAACTTVIADLDSWKVIAINPDAHSFGQWQEEIPTTCTADGTKGHKTCALCQKDYDAEGKLIEDLTIKSEGHDYVAGTSTDSTCLAHGEVIYTCSVSGCGDSYVGYVPARSGTTWDFSGNGVTSTDGKNTLSFVACADETVHTSIPAADGALSTQDRVTMSLSESITLKADQDWVVEVIAKGDGTNPISNILSTGKNVKTATYIFISKSGDLSIGKRLDSFVGDDGTTKSGAYVYYHVSDADYEASVLASDSFDVTEYHNYQLRHSADGVFSFWVDGQKIGDLTLTENGYNRSTSYVKSTAARDDLEEDLVMTHIGGGLSSNSYTNFGVLGSIKYLGAYTGHTADADDGDCTTDILCAFCNTVMVEGAKSHTPAADDGDCTTDILCTVCGSVATKGNKSHSFTQNLASDVVAKAATCKEPAQYYIHCDNCTVNHETQTVGVGEPNGHDWDEGVVTLPPTGTTVGIRTLTCKVEGCGETTTVDIPMLEDVVSMTYDDRLPVTELGQAGEPVISEQVVTSFKVGTETPDDAVLVYDSGKLIAVGTGTAKVTWGTGDAAVSYNISVSPAPISLIMITGHSLGAGSRGVEEQSIVNEVGQVYSTSEIANDYKLCVGDSSGVTGSVDIDGMGLGYGSEIRPEEIDAMTSFGDGVVGSGSAVAYQWNKLTGEKIWVLNSSIGSSQLNTWQKGGVNYKHAVKLFETAEKILNNEVNAGHYTVSHMGVLNFSTANGDQTWTVERYTEAFNSMWNGFQTELALYDYDGDGSKDTVDCIGILPTWGVCSVNDWDNLKPEPLAFYNESGKNHNGKILNYVMSAYGTDGVIIASDGARSWTSDSDVKAYFTANPIKNMYGVLQDGTYHTAPTTVRGINYDGIHFNQMGYNVQGIEAATSLYEYWYGTGEQTTLKLLQSDGVTEVPASVTITEGKNYIMVPAVFPTSAKVTYEITGDDVITYESGYVTATGVGSAKLTIKDLSGNVLKTVDITTEKRSEEFYEDIDWYVWNFNDGTTSTDGENTLTVQTGTMTQNDGKVDFEYAVAKLGKGVLLDKTNNWAVEFTLKAKTDSNGAVIDPGSLLTSHQQVASAVTVYLNTDGSLHLMRRGDIGSYTGKYWNYGIAPATLRDLLPDDFDMTQYHTYQLRCTGGVFSYWLDGEKIGDLTTTYCASASYTGEYMDHSSFTVQYLGNGTSSDADKYGIHAVVDEIKIFADGSTLSFDVGLDAAKPIDDMQVYPGDSVTLSRPDTGDYCAKFVGWNTAADFSGITYKVGESYVVADLMPTTLYAQWESSQSETSTHVWGKNPVSEAIKIPADCLNPATYYTSCSECGATSAGTEWEDTFIYGDIGGHSYVAEKVEEQYFKEAANCDHPAIYYKSCSSCGISSKGTDGEATFTNGSKKHEYGDPEVINSTCTSHGETRYTCASCGDSYVTYSAALSGYTWDFTNNSATSTNGGSALSMTKSATGNTYAAVPIENGALTAESRVAMTLSKTVTLKADADWAIEVVAKGNGVNPIGSVAVHGSYSVGNSKTVFVYIDETGDLSIGKKYSFTGDNGSASAYSFAYYKVSNADYNASVLASDDFDVTEYHTYQLRHSAEGGYSFWLDGEKIGDLALTEDGISRTNAKYVEYTGAREDLDIDLKISYFGCGDSASGYTNMGLLGSVKLYGLYTGHSYSAACDPDCNNEGCSYVREVEHSYEDDGDCTTAVVCSVCNNVVIDAKLSHSWSELYGYTASGHYHACTECGTRGTEADHISSGEATADTAETCTVCGYVINAALNHTHGTKVTTHTGTAATCVATGTKTYYECSCGKVFEDAACTSEVTDLETWILIAVDEAAHSYSGKASESLKSEATCTEPAQYYAVCDLCGEVHGSMGVPVGEALGHDFTAEVAEDQYLQNKPDCDTVAVYYKSCAVCGTSSKGSEEEATFATKEVHNYKADVKLDSTCISHGETVLTCADCGDSYLAYVPAFSGVTWDFTQGSAVSTDGKNTLTVFKSFNDTYQEIPLVDGALVTEERLTMKLSNTVTLKRSDDWVVELIAKPNSGGAIRAFLSTNFATSSSTYFYIDESGDLSIAKKMDYTSDDGITVANKYCYYKVSNADYNASILADTSFDVTQYHTYQLRCTDGVYSFWLDGGKIGDLALTENTPNRSDEYAEYTGPRDDLGTLKMAYIGCGDGTNRAGLGLLGSVKYVGIYSGHSYTNDCDTSCNIEACGHTREVTHKYTDDGDCTTATVCDECGSVIVDAKLNHTWSEAYDYTTTEHYRVCTECGKEEERHSHVSSGSATDNEAEVCTVCGYVITAALSHVHAQVVTTHTGVPATCQATGTKTYYECSCGKLYEDADCTTEIADLKSWNVVAVGDHSFTAETATVAYLKSEANYENSAVYYKSCSTCGLSSAGQSGEAVFEYGYPSDGYFNVITKSQWDTAPGIKETEMVLNNETGDRRQEIYFMEVDLSNEYTSILPSYKEMNPTLGNYGKAVMSEQAAWVEENWDLNVVGAMNTFSTGYSSDYYKENPERICEPLGLLVINGEVYSNTKTDVNGTNGPETCLVVNYDEKDGVTRPASIPKVELRDTDDGLTGWEEQVVPCLWGWLVKDGVNLSNAVDHESVNPRSVIGIKADGTLVMLVDDGRRIPYSYGMSYYELGEMMLALGCVDAVNCDGGGSSTFISQRPGEELQVNNHPTNGGERATITGILAISTAPSTGEFVRASVTTEAAYYTPGSSVQFDAVGVDLAGNSADIPADAVWKVTDGMGTVDKNGLFTSNGTVGEVTAQLVYNGDVVGSATINIVNPDKLAFAQSVITIPNGKGAELNIVATYGIYDVEIKPSDVVFELSDPAIGTMDGFTLNATEDLSVTSGSITMTYVHDTSLTSTAQLIFGQASEVLFDFEDGAGDWIGHRGAARYQAKWEVSAANRDNGQVHSGDGALAVLADFSYSTSSAQNYFNVTYTGETITIENAQSLGFWVYVPEEVPYTSIMVYFYSNGDFSKQVKTEVLHNDENTAKTGWQYVSIDISKHDSVTLKNNVVFFRVYSAMTQNSSGLVSFPGLNYKATWYFDDVTVDYSSAVDDRESPVFDEIIYASNYSSLDGQVIADNYPTFEAYVAEDLAKSNATGLDGSTAAAYIDGNQVPCAYQNGTITVTSSVKLADGPHKVEVSICDKAGNVATISSSFTVAAYEATPTVQLVPHDETLDKLLMGSQYWVDVVASNVEKTQVATLKLDLNNHSTWELDHMKVADGFTATWSRDMTNPTENIAVIRIERTGSTDLTGEGVLVSIPIHLWEWNEDEVPSNTSSGELYSPADRWALGLIFKSVLSVKVMQGTLILTDGSTIAFNDEDLVVDTELYINSYNRNDSSFFNCGKDSWHIHMVGQAQDKDATCTEEGYIGRVFCVGCACGSTTVHDATNGCGAILTWGTTIPATGHTYEVIGDQIACACGEALGGNGIVGFNGALYYMISGKLATGWQNVGYDWYYADPETKELVTGEQTISGQTYTFDEEGKLTVEDDGFVTIDGTTYYYEDGQMCYAGLIEIDGSYYYVNSRFEVVTGRNYISKTNDLVDPGYYEFDETGKMIRDIQVELFEDKGTMKITYTTGQEYSNVHFAVWSDANGHDDLRWYRASETTEGTWTYTVDLTTHDTLGKYYIHAYDIDSGVYNKLIEHVVNVETLPQPTGNVVVSDDCKTMEVTYTADSQYQNVRYAVWSETGGQDDLHWYAASKTADGTWAYTVDLTMHNTVGKYHIHVYNVDAGVYTKLAEYTAYVEKLASTFENVIVSDDCKTMEVNYAADAQYENIHYAVWSQSGGQDDLRWYAASKTAAGVWTYTVDLRIHNTTGKYYIHVYNIDAGVYTKLAEYTAYVEKLPPAFENVTVSDDCKTMEVNYAADAEHEHIHYAVWSETGGQDDLQWYAASKTAEGTWTYTVDLRIHNTVGKYCIHVYAIDAGVYTKLAEYTANVEKLAPAFENVTVSNDCKTMGVTYAADAEHEHVHYAVWSEIGGQDDLQWYAASETAEKTWSYTVDLTTHNTAGKYYIHVYAIDDGVYTKLAEYTANVKAAVESPVEVTVSADRKTLTIAYMEEEQQQIVHMAVWSEVNGQDDLQWYAANRSSDGKWTCTVNLADHSDAGKLNIHVYSITGTVYTKLVESTPEI